VAKRISGDGFGDGIDGNANGSVVQALKIDDGIVQVPDTGHLLHADFSRVGHDLVISAPDGTTYLVQEYFSARPYPNITDGDAVSLRGELVARLAGPLAPGQVAQDGASADAAPIGQVEAISGDVIAIRADGTEVTLSLGDPVYLDDFSNDDDVTVIIDKSIDVIVRDANGNTVRDMTFRIDPSSRSKSVAHGKIVDGVLTTDPFTLHFVSDPGLMPEFHLDEAQLRLTFQEDGSLNAFLGGYHAWLPVYWSQAQGGWTLEHAAGLDLPAIYYAFKRFADYAPDPETGENQSISGTWTFDAVPAFIFNPREAVTQASAE